MLIAHFLLHIVLMLFQLAQDALQFVRLGIRSRPALQAENLFLRKQLALYLECKPNYPAESTSVQAVLGWLDEAGRNRRSADWGVGDLHGLHRGREICQNG
jgi:hypothetical protein